MAGVKGRSGGHNKKSRDQHEREGTYRPDRHGGRRSPDPPRGRPEPPEPLEGMAAREWNRMCDRLAHDGVLSLVDDAVMYEYCRLFAETEDIVRVKAETAASIVRLEEHLAGLEGGDLVQCYQEIVKLRTLEARYIGQVRQGRLALRSYLVEFGLTPASRGRVRVHETQEDQPISPLAALQQQAGHIRRVK